MRCGFECSDRGFVAAIKRFSRRRFAIIEVQADPDQVFAGKHKQKAKIDKQKFLEAIKEQQEAKGQTSRTDENSKVRVIVTLDADAAVDHTAKPTGSTESVKKIEKAVDKVKGSQADVRKQVEKISGSNVKRSFGYLVNGFSIDVKVSDLQKIQDLKGVASVKPVRVYYPADSSANEMADVQKSGKITSSKAKAWSFRLLIPESITITRI